MAVLCWYLALSLENGFTDIIVSVNQLSDLKEEGQIVRLIVGIAINV